MMKCLVIYSRSLYKVKHISLTQKSPEPTTAPLYLQAMGRF